MNKQQDIFASLYKLLGSASIIQAKSPNDNPFDIKTFLLLSGIQLGTSLAIEDIHLARIVKKEIQMDEPDEIIANVINEIKTIVYAESEE